MERLVDVHSDVRPRDDEKKRQHEEGDIYSLGTSKLRAAQDMDSPSIARKTLCHENRLKEWRFQRIFDGRQSNEKGQATACAPGDWAGYLSTRCCPSSEPACTPLSPLDFLSWTKCVS